MLNQISRRRVLQALSLTMAGSPWLSALADLQGDHNSPKFSYKARIIKTGEIVDIDNDDVGQLIFEGQAKIVEDKSSIVEKFEYFSSLSAPRFMKFENVMKSITPEIEAHFDYFICVNTAVADSSPTNFVPAQFMSVIGRSRKGQNIFERNSSQEIIGITAEAQKFQTDFFETYLENALKQSAEYARRNDIDLNYKNDQLPYALPVSTGLAGSGSILTISGAFQIHFAKTRDHKQSTIGSPMSHAMYIYYRYSSGGRWSGIAVHGTPPSNWKKLGASRASHGCVRTLPYVAKALRSAFFESSSFLSPNLPEFDANSALPKLTGKNISERRPKAVIVLFEGYQRPNIHLG